MLTRAVTNTERQASSSKDANFTRIMTSPSPAAGIQWFPYVIDDAVHFIGGSSGAGKSLDVWRGLSDAERSNKHDKKHLNEDTQVHAGLSGPFPPSFMQKVLPQVLTVSKFPMVYSEFRMRVLPYQKARA